MKMSKFRGMLALLALVGMAGCSDTSAPIEEYSTLILGNWECNGTTREDGMSASYTGETSYIADGSSTGMADIVINGQGTVITAHMDVITRWELSGTLLTDTLVKISVTDLTVSGENITSTNRQIFTRVVRDGLESDEDFQPGKVSNSSIDLLNETMMKFTDLDDGEQHTCKRKT